MCFFIINHVSHWTITAHTYRINIEYTKCRIHWARKKEQKEVIISEMKIEQTTKIESARKNARKTNHLE